ncbi:MEDS domain-containing protein [Pseudonocardia bannensis]|uniref:MEDS domain-containing protein n=1 Tax=Pseudonocardia bannensis TaxID=630973 RepID=A0A848DSV1_9PSEU|nr:MEDS domain-containing protein [Pseudonocardia bannensis]NMH95593.1 hypothetical protein [Pseudonocardia bannensis]
MATTLVSRGPVRIGGIAVADRTHLCAPYRSRAERDRLLLPFLRCGLRRGDVCLCVTAPGQNQDLTALVAEDGRELQTLQPLGSEGAHLRVTTCESDALIDLLDPWSRHIVDDDPSAFARVAADMSRAVPRGSPGFGSGLAGFESRLGHWVRGYPQVGMCLFDLNLFGGDVVIRVIEFHPRTWVSGVVVDNPHCLDPGAPVPGPRLRRGA